MLETRSSKSGFPARPMLTIMLVAASSVSYIVESIDQLTIRTDMDYLREAIKRGDHNVFKTLPAKGYKNGFIGLLIKTNTYASPEYSFADCDTDTVIISVQEHKTLPGCRVSLKLTTRDSDSSYHDSGIRTEYNTATDSKKSIASDSAWAQRVIGGDKVLKLSLKQKHQKYS